MFNILSQITLKVKFLRNEEQHCLLPSLVDDFTCVHSKNALLIHILSALFSSTSVLFSCAPFGTKSYIYIYIYICACVCVCVCDIYYKVNAFAYLEFICLFSLHHDHNPNFLCSRNILDFWFLNGPHCKCTEAQKMTVDKHT